MFLVFTRFDVILTAPKPKRNIYRNHNKNSPFGRLGRALSRLNCSHSEQFKMFCWCWQRSPKELCCCSYISQSNPISFDPKWASWRQLSEQNPSLDSNIRFQTHCRHFKWLNFRQMWNADRGRNLIDDKKTTKKITCIIFLEPHTYLDRIGSFQHWRVAWNGHINHAGFNVAIFNTTQQNWTNQIQCCRGSFLDLTRKKTKRKKTKQKKLKNVEEKFNFAAWRWSRFSLWVFKWMNLWGSSNTIAFLQIEPQLKRNISSHF